MEQKNRVVTKIGDLFSVKLDNESRKFFQLIASDPLQLNSDVIRAFKREFPIDESPKPDEIVSGEVQFYSHCIVTWGMKLGLWEKVGKSPDVGKIEQILFCLTPEYARKKGEERLIRSDKWYVWRIVDDGYTDVGRLEGENKKAEFGVVFTPHGIAFRTPRVSIINEYDKAKRVTKRCYSKPNLNITATTCNGLGTNASENTPEVTFLYDGLLELSQSPSSPNLAKGKLTRVSSSVSDTRYTQFDSLGRLTQMQQITDGVTYTSQYQYNFAGALVQETYPSGRVVRNEFESDGDLSRIWGIKDANAPERTYANSFSYTADGKIEKLKLGNNRWEWAKFNERLQVTELNLGAGVTDASLWKLTYHYGELNSDGRTVDAAKNTGNIAMQTVSFASLTEPFVQTYRYDSLYRITEARETNGATTNAAQNWKETFGYDRFGNRTNYAKFTGATQLTLDNKSFPTINPATNRFDPNQGYLYDKNGNLISDAEGRNFVFNGENKQAKIIKDGKLVGEYDYNGEGQRVRKRSYDGNGILQDTTVFVYSAGKLVAEYTTAAPPENPTTRYTATDMLGSPRVITDSEGYVIARRDFKPFGEEITNNTGERTTAAKYGVADNLKQKFTTYQRDDESGLDFAEARMYENRHGRFTAVDPLPASGKSANPQTFNRFVYCLNSPLILIDPDGESHIIVSVDSNHRATITFYYLRNGRVESKTFYGLAAGVGADRGRTRGPIPFGVYKGGAIQGGNDKYKCQGCPGGPNSWGKGRVEMTGGTLGDFETFKKAGIERSGFFFHGGGKAAEAFDEYQSLMRTEGCIRMYNADVVELIKLIRLANSKGDALDNIFVGADGVLTAWANLNDKNGKPLFPELEKWRGRVVNGASAMPGGQASSQSNSEQENRSTQQAGEPAPEPEATASDRDPVETEEIERRRSH